MLCMVGAGCLGGCAKSTDSTPPVELPDGADLLGLRRDHRLEYIIYDSTVTLFPVYSVTVDTTPLNLQITRGGGTQVQLSVNGVPHDLLTIDAVGVLHSGQIYMATSIPETLYFYPTPLLLPATFAKNKSWSLISPLFRDDSGEERRLSVLFMNYGFNTVREFVGTTAVVLPTGSYNAYQFRSTLHLGESTGNPLALIDEYYAPSVGLVKLVSVAGGSRRLILLLQDL